MADLVTKRKISVIGGGSLSARMNQAELAKDVIGANGDGKTLDPSKMDNRLVLMLDCSGSMIGESIKLLASACQDFISKADFSNTAIAIESFPKGIRYQLLTDKIILWMACTSFDAGGGTPMSEAMSYSRETYPLTRGLIISDGQPDNQEACKREAHLYKEKSIPLDCIHISNSTSGEELLKTLAEITGGIYVKFKDTASFAQAFHFLLPETRANAARLMLSMGANEVKD